jgi:hypothetical protein
MLLLLQLLLLLPLLLPLLLLLLLLVLLLPLWLPLLRLWLMLLLLLLQVCGLCPDGLPVPRRLQDGVCVRPPVSQTDAASGSPLPATTRGKGGERYK